MPEQFRILIVEDEPTDALFLRSALVETTGKRYDLDHVERLEEAKRALGSTHYDALLLDLGLPDSQGLHTFLELNKLVPQVPLLVLTGLHDEELGVEAVRRGAQDYLVKDQVQPSLLSRAIRYAIERSRIAAELAASEQRFELAVSGSDAGLWDWNLKTEEIYLAPRFKALLGYADAERPNEIEWYRESIHPSDRTRMVNALKKHLSHEASYDVEYRALCKSGEYRWFNARGQALFDSSNEPYRMVGWIMDITARKEIENELEHSKDQLRRLAARIQSTREEERKRISREIHDVLGQQLTGMKMDLRWMTRYLERNERSELSETLNQRVQAAEELTDESITVVQRLAVELRPSVLDNLGVIEAMRDEARRFESRTGIQVLSDLPDAVKPISEDVSIALFRIYQEILTNVARHADAQKVEVFMSCEGDAVVLSIEDNGRGCSPDVVSRADSLGLLGISERAAQLHGRMTFYPNPGLGTKVVVHIPLT